MAVAETNGLPSLAEKTMLYHFCRMQLPALALTLDSFDHHLERTFRLFESKAARAGLDVRWRSFLDNLYAVDWFLCCACLQGDSRGWECLFAARAHRADCLLVDALRARAVRLFPRDSEKQDSAVTDFWGFLLTGEKQGAVPVLAKFDGQRPLVPWLIRVFQNRHISELRKDKHTQQLPDGDVEDRDLSFPVAPDGRWNEEFRLAAREWLSQVSDTEALILGLRVRYRMSQRELAGLLGIHEGNVSRHTTHLQEHCREEIGKRLVDRGWTGDDLTGFILKEMDTLLMDEPRLAADRLAALLARRGKKLPGGPGN
jgi:RNA polymerase sigma factor (sigma-70 family)